LVLFSQFTSLVWINQAKNGAQRAVRAMAKKAYFRTLLDYIDRMETTKKTITPSRLWQNIYRILDEIL
jgi:hypothetical protein